MSETQSAYDHQVLGTRGDERGILEGIASLRGEGLGQKAPAGDVLTDVADHRDLEVLKGVVAHVSNRGPPQAV